MDSQGGGERYKAPARFTGGMRGAEPPLTRERYKAPARFTGGVQGAEPPLARERHKDPAMRVPHIVLSIKGSLHKVQPS